MYVEGLFAEGDREANSIPTKQSRNMHVLWDGLLGTAYDSGDVCRRIKAISSCQELVELGKKAVADDNGLLLETWLKESLAKALGHAYTAEVSSPIIIAVNSKTAILKQIDLSDAYLKEAGRFAQERAIQAAYRLKVWESGLKGTD